MIFPILLIILTCFYAYLFLKAVGYDCQWHESLGLSYLLGMGCFTYLMFILNWLGLPFNKMTGLSLIIVLTLIFSLLSFKKFNLIKDLRQSRDRLKKYLALKGKFIFWQKLMIVNLIFMLISVIVRASYWPVSNWDSIVLYDYLAKQFASKGFIDYGVESAFLGYPFLISLSHAWLYLFKIFQAGLIHSLFYTAFILVFFSFIRKKTNLTWALIAATFLALSSPFIDHAFMTYTNLAYSIYLCTSFLYFINWYLEKKNSNVIIAALLLGLSTWTRSIEPFWLLSIGLMGYLTLRSKKLSNFFLLAISILVVTSFMYSWQFYKKQVSNQLNFVSTAAIQMEKDDYYGLPLFKRINLKKIQESSQYFLAFIILPTKSNYLLYVATIIIYLANFSKFRSDVELLSLILLILVNLMMIYLGIIYFSINYPDWKNIGGSATRMALFINPLILYVAALISFRALNLKQKK